MHMLGEQVEWRSILLQTWLVQFSRRLSSWQMSVVFDKNLKSVTRLDPITGTCFLRTQIAFLLVIGRRVDAPPRMPGKFLIYHDIPRNLNVLLYFCTCTLAVQLRMCKSTVHYCAAESCTAMAIIFFYSSTIGRKFASLWEKRMCPPPPFFARDLSKPFAISHCTMQPSYDSLFPFSTLWSMVKIS